MGQDVKVGEFLHSKMVQASFHPDLATALGPHRGPKMVMSTVGQSLPPAPLHQAIPPLSEVILCCFILVYLDSLF